MNVMEMVLQAQTTDADAFLMGLKDEYDIEWLAQFWAASRRPIREVIEASTMTHTAFAEHFCISVRTVNEWSRGGRGCPIYTNLLLQEALGMFKRIP